MKAAYIEVHGKVSNIEVGELDIPEIDNVFPLDQAREAEEYLKAGVQYGKILMHTN